MVIKTALRRLLNYLSISTIVLGTIIGSINSANAATLTLVANDTWNDGDSGVLTAPTAGDAIALGDFTAIITQADGANATIAVGAVTGVADDGTPTLDINFADDAATTDTISIASVSVTADADTAGLIDIDLNDGDTGTVNSTLTFTGDVDTGTESTGGAYGDIDIDHADSAVANATSTINFGGDVTANTVINQGAETVVLVMNGTAAQTITGTINSNGGAGEGKINLTNTGGTVAFASALGTGTDGDLALIDLTAAGVTATFAGAVESTTVTNTGTATFDSTLTGATTTLETGATGTFTGKLTATTKLDLQGTATAYIGYGNTTTASSNNVALVDMSATSTLHIQKTVTNAMGVFKTTNIDAGEVATGAKIYMPVNLSNGQSLTLFTDTDAGGDVDTAVDLALQDNALITYAATEATQVVTVAATEASQASVESSLEITANDAKSLSQAYAAAINDTNADSTAEDAFGNALNALGGYSALEDTALAKQVAPQTDLISGSTVASQAVTGSVQGIMSNRMASLRSGDAYFGTGIAAGGISAQSGFIQVFGSIAEQNNTKVGSGTKAGFESESQGIAIGFDGVTDEGMTVGVSLAQANTELDGKGTGKSTNSIDSYSASLYMDMATDNGYIEGSVTYGMNENTTKRKVTSAGLSRTYSGSYDSTSMSLNITAGSPNEVANGYLTPFGSLTMTNIDTDAYTEKSTAANDALRLKVDQNDVTSTVGTVGIKYHTEMSNGGTPMISLALNNELGDNTIESTNTYQGGGTPFKTSTAVEELSATLGLGYSYGSDSTSIEFAYEADVNDDDYLSHYGSIKIVGKF